MSALRFSGAHLGWVKANMYGTAFRANNLPIQTLVTRSSWHVLFVCWCLQFCCLRSLGAIKMSGVQKTGLSSYCALGDLTAPRRLSGSGVSDGQQRAPTRLLLNFPKAWEKEACFQEVQAGLVLHVHLFQLGRGG